MASDWPNCSAPALSSIDTMMADTKPIPTRIVPKGKRNNGFWSSLQLVIPYKNMYARHSERVVVFQWLS